MWDECSIAMHRDRFYGKPGNGGMTWGIFRGTMRVGVYYANSGDSPENVLSDWRNHQRKLGYTVPEGELLAEYLY